MLNDVSDDALEAAWLLGGDVAAVSLLMDGQSHFGFADRKECVRRVNTIRAKHTPRVDLPASGFNLDAYATAMFGISRLGGESDEALKVRLFKILENR